MLLRTRRVILGVLITSHVLTGCYSWKVVAVSPRALVDSAHVSAIQVEEKGGAKYLLYAPRVAGDSLMGIVGRVLWQPQRMEQGARTIPLATVYQVAVRKFDGLKTVGAIVGIPMATFGLMYFIACAGGGSTSGYVSIC